MKNPISKNFHEPLNSMSSVKTVQSLVARGGSIMVGNRYWMPPPRQCQPMFQVSANSGGQRITGDQKHVFLWTVKTLHGANLNNQCTKKRYYAMSQSKGCLQLR